MTWMLYHIYSSSLSGYKLREFFDAAEDWDAVRAYDNGSFNETDLSTGGI